MQLEKLEKYVFSSLTGGLENFGVSCLIFRTFFLVNENISLRELDAYFSMDARFRRQQRLHS